MSIDNLLRISTSGAGTAINKTITITDEAILDLSFDVADGQTDEEHIIAVDVSEAKSVYIVSDQAIAMEWNDGAGTQGDMSLLAGEPVVWWSTQVTDGGNTLNPLGATDITSTFWTNASGSTANINFQVVSDASP
ncbi:hypothetical protein LCGC14_0323400 [marine sediment metagenome]|uniref:Uncharacterized protein n=1 Tax=marine sediment metagenome TaxID=412755 RepID=A0A0F9W612_9ZZZZ